MPLANYRDIIVGENSGGFYFLDTEDKIIHSYSIRPLATEEVEHYRDRYYDGTVYIETEDEYEPVRIMKSLFHGYRPEIL